MTFSDQKGSLKQCFVKTELLKYSASNIFIVSLEETDFVVAE